MLKLRYKIVYTILSCLLFVSMGFAAGKRPAVQSGPAPVVVAPVTAVTSGKTAQTIGSITDPKMATLSAADAGHVAKIAFSDGQQVKKGQLLVELNDATEKAQLANAQAKLMASKAAYERSLQLSQGKVDGLGVSPLGQQDLMNYKSTYLQDKAMAAQMQAQLDKRYVLAPFAGKTGAVKVSVGDYVTAGQALVTLVNYQTLQVSFSIAENEIGQLQLGQTIYFTTPLFPGKRFSAQLSFMAPAVDANTRTLACLATIQHATTSLRPGLFVQVDLSSKRKQAAVQVLEQALVPDYPNYVVYRVVNSKAVKTPVVIGQRENGQVIIQQGVTLGEQVVIAGQDNLSNGQSVAVKKQ
jgi:membrane fusion protein (multidrug efflux system)